MIRKSYGVPTVRRVSVLAALYFLVVAAAHGAEADGIDVHIGFYDKKIYYLDQAAEIRLRVTVVNRSLTAIRFRVADDRVFNLDFEVRTLANVQLRHSRDFSMRRDAHQHVFFRDVELQAGEEYSFVVALPDYIQVDKVGVLTVQGFFYPELMRHPDSRRIASNVVAFHVRPAVPTERERELLAADTGKLMQREDLLALPPDEVVEFTIRARQQDKMEERFFLYLDVESLMLQSAEWRRRHERLSEEGRRDLVAEYRAELRKQAVDQGSGDEGIILKPSEFEILNTQYTPTEGTVTVLEKFRYRDFAEVKEYTYYLERRGRLWVITSYEVMNLGSE